MSNNRFSEKKFKEFYWEVVFGGKKQLKFEDRLIITTSLVIAMVSLISVFFNIFMKLGSNMIYSTLLLFVAFVGYFLIARFRRIGPSLYYLFTFTVFAYLDFAWYNNYGSRGSVISFFIVAFAFLIFVWDTRKIIYLAGILAINLFVLSYLEYQNPNIVGNYANEHTRIVDYYFGFFLAMFMILIFALIFKKNYLIEYKKAQKADELKSAFLANMSHEVRTPLNAIVGFSGLITEEHFARDEVDVYKKHIQDNSEYLLELLDNIVDMSKIEVDELKLNYSKIDLSVLFQRLKEDFDQFLKNTSGQITINYRLNLEDSKFETAGFRLEQVLRHLISNAIKFTSKGEIVFGCEHIGTGLTFYVKDTGIGIHEENQEQIFDRFVKLEDESQELHRGTGIGLFLSKKIIEKMGGQIWVYSRLGLGSTFYFTLPIIML